MNLHCSSLSFTSRVMSSRKMWEYSAVCDRVQWSCKRNHILLTSSSSERSCVYLWSLSWACNPRLVEWFDEETPFFQALTFTWTSFKEVALAPTCQRRASTRSRDIRSITITRSRNSVHFLVNISPPCDKGSLWLQRLSLQDSRPAATE